MTDRNACKRWMEMVAESGSFRAWYQRQNNTNQHSNGNDKVACQKWLDHMGTILPTVVDTTLILKCIICQDISTEVNLCRRCEGLYCVKCTRLDDRCRWCREIQGYALNRGARNLQLWWLFMKSVDWEWTIWLLKILVVLVFCDIDCWWIKSCETSFA